MQLEASFVIKCKEVEPLRTFSIHFPFTKENNLMSGCLQKFAVNMNCEKEFFYRNF